MPYDLDSYDKRILAILQCDSSRSNADIASEIGLSEIKSNVELPIGYLGASAG